MLRRALSSSSCSLSSTSVVSSSSPSSLASYAPTPSFTHTSLHLAQRNFITRLFGPRRDPIYYSKLGHADVMAEYFSSGRADVEWIRLRMLCAFTTTSTWGVWLYGVYFPEKVKQYRDEPWSPLSD